MKTFYLGVLATSFSLLSFCSQPDSGDGNEQDIDKDAYSILGIVASQELPTLQRQRNYRDIFFYGSQPYLPGGLAGPSEENDMRSKARHCWFSMARRCSSVVDLFPRPTPLRFPPAQSYTDSGRVSPTPLGIVYPTSPATFSVKDR